MTVTVQVFIPGDRFVTMAVDGTLRGWYVDESGGLVEIAEVVPLDAGQRCERHPDAGTVPVVTVHRHDGQGT